MFKLIGKLIKFVIILAVIIAIPLGVLYVGSEVFDLDVCEEILDEMEDFFDDVFDGASDGKAEMQKEYHELLPNAKELNRIALDEYGSVPKTISEVYRDVDGAGYVMTVNTVTSYTTGEPMTFSIGINSEGTITGLKMLVYTETKDFGRDEYLNRFVGESAKGLIEKIENGGDLLVSGVTYSSKAFVLAMFDALNFAAYLDGREQPMLPGTDNSGNTDGNGEEPEIEMSDYELLRRMAALCGSTYFTEILISPNEAEYVKRLFKDENGGGYLAYLVVMSQYGTIETETIVYVSADLRIAAIDKVLWSPSDAMPDYGFYPPSEEVVDAFYDRLIGAGTYELHYNFLVGDAELATGATSTSKNLVESIYEAFNMIGKYC